MNINFSNKVLYPRTKVEGQCIKPDAGYCFDTTFLLGRDVDPECLGCRWLQPPAKQTYSPGDVFIGHNNTPLMLVQARFGMFCLINLRSGNMVSDPRYFETGYPLTAEHIRPLSLHPVRYVGRLDDKGVLTHGPLG